MEKIAIRPVIPDRPMIRRRISASALVVAAMFAGLLALAFWMLTSQFARDSAAPDAATRARLAFEEQTGVRIVRVAVTGGGGMLDLRYQTLDPDKALTVHDRKNPPKLIDAASGETISRPWMQHAHKRDLHTAVTYYQLLMNPRGVVKRGSKVAVVIGDARLENVIVQ